MGRIVGALALVAVLLGGGMPAQASATVGVAGDGVALLGRGGQGLSILTYHMDAFGQMTVIFRNNTNETITAAEGGLIIYDKQETMIAASQRFFPQFGALAPGEVGAAIAVFTPNVGKIGRVVPKLVLSHDASASRYAPLTIETATKGKNSILGVVTNQSAQAVGYPIRVVAGCIDNAGRLTDASDDAISGVYVMLKQGDSLPFELNVTEPCPHIIVFAAGAP